MNKSILKFESCIVKDRANPFRTVIKTQHGRILFLMVEIDGDNCKILDCFYVDRNQGKSGPERYNARPMKLQTFRCSSNALLSVIETELDKKFYQMEFIQSDLAEYENDEYINFKLESMRPNYNFLIMVGEGETYNGLPVRLRTRLKNKLHRSIYVELEYYKDGKGVVRKCYFYDRSYKRQDIQRTPQQLISCFFPYSRQGILNLLNHEICCDFTHMILTDHAVIDIDRNKAPLCGAI